MSAHEISNGSLRQLWKISSALMISFLSALAMMFADRLFLSQYSAEALSAAASAGTLFWAGGFMCITFAAMGEVFVAQRNGAKQYQELGNPVWQMIWFSVFSFFFFFVLGFFGSHFCMKTGLMNVHEAEYFEWNNYYAPWLTLLTAISAFYIGQGKTRIITWLGVLGNGVNIILDPLLIFGKWGFPSLGIKGAAIATGIGVMVQIVIIGTLFLQKKNRVLFGTRNWKFDTSLFSKCLRIGSPPAFFALFELLGWAIFYMMMGRISTQHILVASITQSILFLFLFFGFGLEKGAAAIAGNLIGSNNHREIKRLFWSGIKLSLGFGVIVMIFLGTFSDFLVDLFLENPETLAGSFSEIPVGMLQEIRTCLKSLMIPLSIYLTLENIRWLLSGLLTSAGDTFLPMILGLASIWFFLLAPTYFFVVIPQASMQRALNIWVFYSFIAAILFFIRFARGKWKEKKLILDHNKQSESFLNHDATQEMSQ